MRGVFFALAMAAVIAAPLRAADIKVIGSPGLRQPYTELVPGFEKSTAHKVTTTWGGVNEVANKPRPARLPISCSCPSSRSMISFARKSLTVRIQSSLQNRVGRQAREEEPTRLEHGKHLPHHRFPLRFISRKVQHRAADDHVERGIGERHFFQRLHAKAVRGQ